VTRDDLDFIEPPEPENEWDNPENTEEKAYELQDTADQAGHPSKCVFCGHNFFWLPGDKAWVEGQVYSQMGARETKISQVCEFCFDGLMTEEDDPVKFAHYKALKEKRAQQREDAKARHPSAHQGGSGQRGVAEIPRQPEGEGH
jgi:hypothetical protein